MPPFPRNASGQTYGSCADVMAADYPDLVAVTGRDPDGEPIDGYVLGPELLEATGENVDSVEEALSRQHEATDLIVYSQDGGSAIGTFTVNG